MELFSCNSHNFHNNIGRNSYKEVIEMSLFKGIKEGFKAWGQNITILINSLLLSIVYLIGVGFTSLFALILRKKFLQFKLSKERESYWTELNLTKKPLEEYYRQF